MHPTLTCFLGSPLVLGTSVILSLCRQLRGKDQDKDQSQPLQGHAGMKFPGRTQLEPLGKGISVTRHRRGADTEMKWPRREITCGAKSFLFGNRASHQPQGCSSPICLQAAGPGSMGSPRCLSPAFLLATSGPHSPDPTNTSKTFSGLPHSSLPPDPVVNVEENTSGSPAQAHPRVLSSCITFALKCLYYLELTHPQQPFC